MKFRYSAVTAVLALVCVSNSSLAHHSRASHYDMENRVTLSGTVTRMEWINPHSYVHLDVKGTAAAVDHWTVELYPTAMMVRLGIEKETIKIGDAITVHGLAPKPGADFKYLPGAPSRNTSGATANVTFALELTLADGTKKPLNVSALSRD